MNGKDAKNGKHEPQLAYTSSPQPPELFSTAAFFEYNLTQVYAYHYTKHKIFITFAFLRKCNGKCLSTPLCWTRLPNTHSIQRLQLRAKQAPATATRQRSFYHTMQFVTTPRLRTKWWTQKPNVEPTKTIHSQCQINTRKRYLNRPRVAFSAFVSQIKHRMTQEDSLK